MNASTVLHPFDPVWDGHSRVLILGTMPSPQSRRQGFYYGHPQNRFWQVLALVLEQPAPQTADEKRAFLLANRIALWDVLACCEIAGAADSSIRNPVVNDIGGLLANSGIRAVFCNGKSAAALYRKLCRDCPECITLPSTSPANCAVGLEGLAEAYRGILPHLQ